MSFEDGWVTTYGDTPHDEPDGKKKNNNTTTAAVLALAGTVAVADGPLPVGDVIGAGILAGYGVYKLGEAIVDLFSNKSESKIVSLKSESKKEEAKNGEHEVTTESKQRKTAGKDGASSEHIIEKVGGKTNSTTHKVTKDGNLIHQHQDHVGKYKGRRSFPDKWTGTKTIGGK